MQDETDCINNPVALYTNGTLGKIVKKEKEKVKGQFLGIYWNSHFNIPPIHYRFLIEMIMNFTSILWK